MRELFNLFGYEYNLVMIPSGVKKVLWSYDTAKIDLQDHKKTIISQVLNLGSQEAVSWLFKTYKKEEIAVVASSIPATAWNKKSLAFWSLVLGVQPPLTRLPK